MPSRPNHLAVTSGALDGIERALTAHLRPGDRVAVEDPGWANLLDLLAALGLSAEPVQVDDDGPVVLSMARALRRGVRAVVVTSRAQNPTGAALTAERAKALRSLLAGKTSEVLVVEDDHCAGIAGVPLYALAGSTRRWAFVRSASKAYGPDLRLAILAGDRRTVERVNGRLRLGPGWVSHLLQDLAVRLWSDDAAKCLVEEAKERYANNRNRLRAALAKRGVTGLRPIRAQRLDSGARRDDGDHPLARCGLGRGTGYAVPYRLTRRHCESPSQTWLTARSIRWLTRSPTRSTEPAARVCSGEQTQKLPISLRNRSFCVCSRTPRRAGSRTNAAVAQWHGHRCSACPTPAPARRRPAPSPTRFRDCRLSKACPGAALSSAGLRRSRR